MTINFTLDEVSGIIADHVRKMFREAGEVTAWIGTDEEWRVECAATLAMPEPSEEVTASDSAPGSRKEYQRKYMQERRRKQREAGANTTNSKQSKQSGAQMPLLPSK